MSTLFRKKPQSDRQDAYARLHRWRQAIHLQQRGELKEKPTRTPWGKIAVKVDE